MSWKDFARLLDENNASPADWANAIEGNPNDPVTALMVAAQGKSLRELCQITITLATVANIATSDEDDEAETNGCQVCYERDHAYERDTRDGTYWRTDISQLAMELVEHDRNCGCPQCEGEPPAWAEGSIGEADPMFVITDQQAQWLADKALAERNVEIIQAAMEELELLDCEEIPEAIARIKSTPATVLDHWFGDSKIYTAEEWALRQEVQEMPADQLAFLAGEEVKPEIQDIVDERLSRYAQGPDGVYRPE